MLKAAQSKVQSVTRKIIGSGGWFGGNISARQAGERVEESSTTSGKLDGWLEGRMY
jgi:hypothetical protein